MVRFCDPLQETCYVPRSMLRIHLNFFVFFSVELTASALILSEHVGSPWDAGQAASRTALTRDSVTSRFLRRRLFRFPSQFYTLFRFLGKKLTIQHLQVGVLLVLVMTLEQHHLRNKSNTYQTYLQGQLNTVLLIVSQPLSRLSKIPFMTMAALILPVHCICWKILPPSGLWVKNALGGFSGSDFLKSQTACNNSAGVRKPLPASAFEKRAMSSLQ